MFLMLSTNNEQECATFQFLTMSKESLLVIDLLDHFNLSKGSIKRRLFLVEGDWVVYGNIRKRCCSAPPPSPPTKVFYRQFFLAI